MNRHLLLLALLASLAAGQTGEVIRNGSFDRDAEGWSLWFSPGLADGRAGWAPRDGGGCLDIQIARMDRPSAVQIYQGPFAVRAGQRFLVRFEARAPQPGSLAVKLMGHEPPYSGLGLDTKVPLTTAWRHYALLATATRDLPNARLDFFPVAPCQLDSVSITAPTEAETLRPPRAVTLGPDWRGDPQALLDGDPQTSVTAGWQPNLPLLLTADLGEPLAVRQVVVGGRDVSQWAYTSRLEVELSDDGHTWRTWANGAKDGPSAQPRLTTYRASSLVVTARYLRVRVTAMTGSCLLTGIGVDAGPAAEGTAIEVLPAIPPGADLAFLGWDYDRLAYAWSPGEAAALRWTNRGDEPVDVPATWRVVGYNGGLLSQGEGRLRAAPRAVGELPVTLAGANERDVVVEASFAPETGVAPQRFHLPWRSGPAAGAVNVLALTDSNDPEEWAVTLFGTNADRVVAYADWPADDRRVPLALVAAEAWPADHPHLTRLRTYLAAGGTAVVYGSPPPGLDDVLPVAVPGRPVPTAWRRLGARSGAWADRFRPSAARHLAVTATLQPGATALAVWDDGSPAVAERRVGQGRLLWIGTGAGQVWSSRAGDDTRDELLHWLVGRALGLPNPEEPKPGIDCSPSRDNVGRFGWLFAEGGLVENLSATGEVRCPGDGDAWGPIFQPTDRAVVVNPGANWVAKRLRWPTAEGDWTATMGLASPLLRWETAARSLALPAPSDLRVAYPSRSGWRVLQPGDAVPGADLARGVLVAFRTDPQRRDQPRVVVLSRRPTTVRLAERLTIDYPAGPHTFHTGRLWGLRRLAPGATAAWQQAVPAEVQQQAERLEALAFAYPTQMTETARVDGDVVTIQDRSTYLMAVTSEFGTPARSLKPLPPVLSLARHDGAPITVDGPVIDLGVATKYGPLEAVEGGQLTYRIQLPPRDHFGYVPTTGATELQEAIDHYGLDGTSSVKRASGGLVGSEEFRADLRRYMSSDSFENPFAAPCIDLYKWWYCFPTVMARPAYGAAAREQIDAHHALHYARTLNLYPHKSYVRHRAEPFSGLDYTVSFIWPVVFRDGVRFFVDQNESAAVIVQCLNSYARYYGDWDTIRNHWPLIRRIWQYLPRIHDWATMASSNQAYFSTVGIDMLNSEYPGNLAYAELARQVGRPDEAVPATVLAAKALVPTVARFAMPDYVRAITAEGDPWREARYYFSLHETDLSGQPTIEMRGGPESVMELAIDMLDTSKGTGPELPLAYQAWIPKRIEAYERELAAEEQSRNKPVGWAHLMQRAILGWPRSELIEGAKRFHAVRPTWGWQSTKGPGNLAVVQAADTPLFLADWQPAEYVAGRYDPATQTVSLRFDNRDAQAAPLRLYSRRKVEAADLAGWKYDPATGWLTATLPPNRTTAVTIRLGAEVAPRHPYFAR